MKRMIALCLVSLSVLSACQNQKKSEPIKLDAVSALENQLSVNDGKLYVYQDYAIGWNRFVMRTWIGEGGTKPPDMDEYYDEEPFSGVSSIKAQIDFTAQSWGGYIFTNGSLKAGDTEPVTSSGDTKSGADLTGATALVFYARGKEGGEKVEFFCGGMGYDNFGASMPYADSSPTISSGTISLSKDWKAYSIPLKEKDMSNIGYGFAWIAYADQNKGKDRIEFYMDEIYYSFEDGRTQMLFAPSYEAYATDTEEYILNSIAYTHDNAAACIALFRAGKPERAKQIADALVFASENDRSFSDGRLRNGYTCGNIESYSGWISYLGGKFSLMPGFYHKQTMKWHEDFYTVSTNLTSLAWGILALSEAYDQCPDRRDYLEAAERIAAFALTLEDADHGGFFSGYEGWEGVQSNNYRKPTRDNIELLAALKRLAALPGIPPENVRIYENAAESAEDYILSQFDETTGCFLPGLDVAESADTVCLPDNAFAILVLPDKYAIQKERALEYIEKNLSVGDGFAYSNADTNGIFWENSGLMALVYMRLGSIKSTDRILKSMEEAQADDGMVFSANINGLFSGLVNFHDNRRVYYYNRKHIGATAFMALANMKANPFVK